MDGEIELKFLFWIGTAMMLILAVTLILISTVYHKRVFQMREKESQKLLQASLESEQKERQRIATDIHDGVLTDLNGARSLLILLQNGKGQELKKEMLETAFRSVDASEKSLRLISYNLMPSSFNAEGLVLELKEYFGRCRRSHALRIVEHYDVSEVRLPSTSVYNIYRIVQEAMNNLMRHGEAAEVVFSLTEQEGVIQLKLRDDGRPFDFFKALQTSKGIGLHSMHLRVQQMGATLEQAPMEKGNVLTLKVKHRVC